jgi:hypothetical protein
MTSIDTILESVGINRQDLTTQVAEHRRMSHNMELVLANHFPVEDLACAVEQLASRLVEIAAELTHNMGDYYVGDLAGDVIDMVDDSDSKDVLEAVREHLGLPFKDEDGDAPIFSTCSIFEHPELRCVTQTVLDHALRTFVRSSYLVDVRTGTVTPVPAHLTAVETAALLAQEAANTDD